MRVLVLSHMYPVFSGDYSGLFVHQQVQALRRIGCMIQVVSPRPFIPWPLAPLSKRWVHSSSVPASIKVDEIDVHVPRYISIPRNYLFEISGLSMFVSLLATCKAILRSYRYQLIHAHTALPDGFAAMLLSRFVGVPYIVTIHGQDFQSSIHFNSRVRRAIQKTLRGSACYVAVSRTLFAKGHGLGVSRKGSVISNGLDCDSIPRMEIGARGEPVIVSVSNLSRTKGIDLNIRAVASLMPKYPSLKYHVIGDGEEMGYLRELVASLGLAHSVLFMGKMKHGDAMKEIGKASVFSMPSSPEGFGIVYLEAMAQAKPVVGCKGEGPEDFVEHQRDGFLVRPRNLLELTSVLDSVLGDPELADRIGRSAREKVTRQFSWHENAEKYMKLYRAVVQENWEAENSSL